MRDDYHRCAHTSEADVSFLAVVATPVTACKNRSVENSLSGFAIDPVLDRIGPILGLIPLERQDVVYV